MKKLRKVLVFENIIENGEWSKCFIIFSIYDISKGSKGIFME